MGLKSMSDKKSEAQKGKPKIPPFEPECKQCFVNMREAFYEMDWPARKDEIKEYIKKLNHYIQIKHFNKLAARHIIEITKNFLFLYKTITGGDLKMTRLPGEKKLHDAVKKLTKEMNRKIRDGNIWTSPDGKA